MEGKYVLHGIHIVYISCLHRHVPQANASLHVHIYTIRSENCSHQKWDICAQREGGFTATSRRHFVQNTVLHQESHEGVLWLWLIERPKCVLPVNHLLEPQNSRLLHSKGWYGKLRVFLRFSCLCFLYKVLVVGNAVFEVLSRGGNLVYNSPTAWFITCRDVKVRSCDCAPFCALWFTVNLFIYSHTAISLNLLTVLSAAILCPEHSHWNMCYAQVKCNNAVLLLYNPWSGRPCLKRKHRKCDGQSLVAAKPSCYFFVHIWFWNKQLNQNGPKG